ncbi:MAG: 1-acyl-sn-glycerol-3-phosphate acyltransferase [Clostridia bacterium]|nr:1-acyl-sn-glycerol-3-phosphate acyltransferase [Clostridia bacterium]
MKEKKIIYYEDELNDEFSEAVIIPRKIDENYKYKKSFMWNVISYIFQNVLSMPIKYCYAKFKLKIKFVGKEKFRKCKKTGFFLYGNHTQIFADTFIPSLADFPKRNFLIVNPENISMKGSGWVVELLGAVPVPGNIKATKNFMDRIEELQNKNCSITIYPEAHIWPYYTKIRPFKSVSFKYPVKMHKPVYCFVNTYQSYGKNNDKVKLVTYIDGPFYADKNLSPKEAQEQLRNKVYETMCKRSENSNIEVIKYIKRDSSVSL